MNHDAIWKSGGLIGIIVSLLFLTGYSSHLSTFRTADNLLYDFISQKNTLPTDSRIILVEVDASSSEQKSHAAIAAAINKLSNAGAKLIALDILYTEPELQPEDNNSGEAQKDMLAENIRLAGNVLLPLYFEFGSEVIQSNILSPSQIRRSTFRQINRNATAAVSAFMLHYPYSNLLEGAAGFGHFNLFPDPDGTVRSHPLAIELSDKFYPSIALVLAAGAMNIPTSDMRLNIGTDIELGALNVATDRDIRIYPAFHTDGSGGSYSRFSLSELLSESTPADLFKDKIILIGSTADNSSNSFITPLKRNMSRIEFVAHSIQSILKEESVIRPGWTLYIELALLLLAGLYLTLLLPRLSGIAGVAATVTATLVLLITGFFLISAFSIWIQTCLTALLLIIGHLCIGIRAHFIAKEQQPSSTSDSNETNKMLGLSFQSQGMLENAYKKFLICPLDEEMLPILYDLGLAFERKRQFDEAINVYQHMATYNSNFRDIQVRLINAKRSKEAVSEKGSNDGVANLLAGGDINPTLGRYEIFSELGKGAMGTVYLGKDPQINRQVAIKTLALSKEFEADQLEEVKKRFFHEAEIAGMLNHPNIVTIFDAGAEHDLAYIAMEYLDGIDLIRYTQKGKTLPIPTTLKIVAKVAEALQYAHDHGVIHRDIKPANIMILKNKSVKVTDFGIAHINDSSKTKAGIVMGTPSYMSPEQLSGKKVDGRSDLFSLGVMLYEMVAGVRPFTADSISKLMLKVARVPHTDVRELDPEVPDSVAELINSMLAKNPENRIASAHEVLDRIHQCLQENRAQEGTP
ncbi:serine/threonine protein kinase [Mariprofundus aestuarium]|uniref:non-specific serine/threonine protein kinase n=1 Tax=Mariprofundus aestuarium TaxID=1921086 RepID=A0A2K8KZM9_MARES|nr:serine/threonine-protein kinase [Mariprofundus aestuarium]ATX80252.1 serine/threonine protein kinase [Mariprofundus aestuarium]